METVFRMTVDQDLLKEMMVLSCGKIKIDLKLHVSPDSQHSLMIKFPRLENFLLSMSLSQQDRADRRRQLRGNNVVF